MSIERVLDHGEDNGRGAERFAHALEQLPEETFPKAQMHVLDL